MFSLSLPNVPGTSSVAERRDRVNIGNASVFGLQTELRLKSVEYNTALTIFFIPYVVFEIPSNILLRKLKPHVWCMSGPVRSKVLPVGKADGETCQCRHACLASDSSRRCKVWCRTTAVFSPPGFSLVSSRRAFSLDVSL